MKGRTVETVVTYLAMPGPPGRLPPQPEGVDLVILRADAVPVHYYRYLYRQVGEPWLWFERAQMTDERLAAKLNRPGVEVHVLHADGVPAGYYELDFTDPQRTNLVYFGLMPEWTGRGLGPWLLGRAVADAFARGASEATVNTCTLDHPAALDLYQRLGFRIVAREERRLSVPAHIPIPRHIAARRSP